MPIDTSKVQWDAQQSSAIDSGKVEWDAPAEAPRERAGFGEALVRGFKRSLPETKSLLYGAGAAAAGAVGADGLRDRALSSYRRIGETEVAPVSGPSLHDVMEGNAGVGEYVGDVLGNFGGQAVQSTAVGLAGATVGSSVPGFGTATGAIGGVLARGAVKKGITRQVERMLASQAERGLVKEGGEQAARGAIERKLVRSLGGGAAANIGLNTGQEVGISYGARADDAQAAGEDLTQGDALRAIGFGGVAGVVDTAAEGLNVGRVLRGASSNPRLVRRLLTGAAEGAITEGGTEATQAALERAGAQQSLTDAQARSDYLENFAAGAIGGGAIGAGGGVRRRSTAEQQPEPTPAPPLPDPANGPVSRAVNLGAANGALQEAQAARAAETGQDELATMRMRPEPGAQEGPRQTFRLPPPPWINQETGEIDNEPDIATAKAYVHEQLNRLEAAGEPIPNRGQWKRELGIGSNLLANTVLGEVRSERANGLQAPAEQHSAVLARLRAGEPATESDRVALGATESLDGEGAARLYADVLGVEKGRARKALDAIPAGDDGRRATLSVLQAAQAALRQKQEPADGSAAAEPAQAALGLDQPAGNVGARSGDARGAGAAPAATPDEPVARGADRTVSASDAAAGERGDAGIEAAAPEAAGTAEAVAPEVRVPQAAQAAGAPGAQAQTLPPAPQEAAQGSPAEAAQAGQEAAPLAAAPAPTGQESPSPSVGQPSATPVGQKTEPRLPSATASASAQLPAPSGQRARSTQPAAPASAQQPQTGVAASGQKSPSAQDTPAAPDLHAAAHAAATSPQNNLPEPTDAQKEAGNYAKGHHRIAGLDVSIENPAGSRRRPEWPPLKDHYGYIRGSVGADKDHVDVFLTKDAEDTSRPVFVVDQVDPKTGRFDEHKVVMGAADEAEARAAYQRNYAKGWKGLSAVTQMTREEFKAWVRDPAKTKRPAAPARAAVKAVPAAAHAAQRTPADAGGVPKTRILGGRRVFVPGARETLEAYFKPGREVQGYGGKDRVINFDWNDGVWSVTVQGLTFNGKDVSDERPRTHSTQPSVQDLRAVFGDPAQYARSAARKAPARAAEPEGKIEDLGEKIGGARKDLAVKSGPRGKRAAAAPVDDRPTWAKRYAISEIAASTNEADVGRWSISDTRKKDRYGQALRPTRETFATREEAEAALPLIELARQHRAVLRDGGWAIARDVTDRKRVILKDGFASREDAMRYMAEHARELLETTTSVGEEALPLPEEVARTGPERRSGDVAGKDFMDTFGFRGVEFGNWNSQAERQEVMNHAFDGLQDLAEVLNIPPKAISLNGDLALAFGARGHGLTGARAHYEPQRGVINLTKMQGAGALAHEWLHALDHYLGRQAGTASTKRGEVEGGVKFPGATADGFLSQGGFARFGDQMRPELRAAYQHVIDTMLRKAEQYVEDTQQAERFLGHARDELGKQLASFREGLATRAPYNRRKPEPASAEQLAEVDQIIDRLLDGQDLGTRLIEAGGARGGMRDSNDSLERLSAILKAVRGRQGFNAERIAPLDRVRQQMHAYATRIKAVEGARAETPKTRKLPTSFKMEAIKADQGRATNYWATPHEMAARAFSAYVEDKLAEQGISSNFLSWGSEHRFVLPIPEFPRPFPGGKEREAINAAFDQFFQTLQTREDEAGRVALFSRAGRAGSDRTSWEGFPPAVIANPFGPGQQQLRTHQDYEAAKGGDRAAAVRLVGDRLTADAVARVRALIGDRKPTLVPVLAEEATGRNKIPLAYAEALGQALGLPVDRGIVQSVRAHHTASSAFHRIAFQAAFGGEVQQGQDYLLLDDAITMGGTLANLRGHIEANGGQVIGVTVLTGHPNGATMALRPATAQRLRETFGNDLDRYLQDEFGFDSSRLTEGEAGHILKARTLGVVRDRIAQARDAAGRGVDGRVLRSASDQDQLNAPPRAGRLASGRLTLERARQLQAELTREWGDNAPSLRLVASAEDLPAAVRGDPDAARIEGVYNGSPVIWLNVGAIRTERRFAEVLAHEVIGHYGVERVVGAEQWAGIVDAIERLDRSGGGSAQLRQIFSEIRQRQPGLDRDSFAREAIAFMAEKGIRNSWVNRVVAAVRRFLRQLMPSRRWTEVEVRALLAQSDSFLRRRTTPAERRALVQRYAFSTDPDAGFGASGLQVDEQPVDVAFVAGLTPKERRSPSMAVFAQALYQDLGTDSPFFRDWFGGSKVVDATGTPLKVYHGTSEEFAAFDPARAGKNTGHMTARLGIFFDARRSKAQHYAEIASGNVPADQRVIEAYLSIERPYEMSKAEFMAVEGTENATELRARLEREGYDGIRLPDIGQWIAFRADQIKATENRGTFDRGDNRMLFSVAPADVLDDITAVMDASQQEGVLARARAVLADMVPRKLKDQARSTWLGALTTRHLTELGTDYFQNIRHYSDFLAEMGADRNQLQQEGEAIAERARKWASKHRAPARQLFDLMHDATIEGVDPAEDFQPLQFRYSGQLHEATPKKIKEALAAIREQMRGRSGDNKKDMIAEAKTLRGMPARDKRRRQKYPGLVARWNQLPPEAQEIYREFRNSYRDRSDAIEKALIARINDTDAPENHKRRIIDVIRRQFEAQRLQGVYFPLQRFGRYFVAAERDGTSTFLMFERLTDLERAVKDLRDRGFKITAQGLKGEGKAQDAPSGTFVAEVIQSLQKAGVSDQTQDEIYQLYLQALPELSMRKHAIHRQSVPGFDPDAVRAFAFNATHGAHQLARLRFAHKLQNVLALLKQVQDKERREEGADTRKIAAGDAILNELEKRHTWIMNPQDSQLTSLVSSFGFIHYLGLTPAAALVNLTQTALVSYPYLAARYGGVRAMNQLLAGMSASIRTAGHIQRTLTDPDELRAHAYLQQSGALDKTQAHNLAGIAEGGLSGYNPAWARAMEVIGWGFHKAEVVNREATGLAAFRLAKSAGKSFDEAVREAVDAINDTHFDYTNQNRARFMQGGTAKVLLMFRQYSLNMTWHLGRMVWQATKGESPEVRRLARRNLTGLLGMSALFSGTLGLPLMSVTMGLLNAIASSFGDDDEPWDAETEFRAFLRDMLGDSAAAVVAGGVVNPVTGADVASRVSLSQLWFRDADRELDGRGAYYNLLEQAAGPMGGVLKNVLVGKQLMDEGHLWRGVETTLPKAMKDAMRAARYASEGVNTLRGDPLVPDASLRDTLLQLTGFTPSKVADRYDRNRALKNYEQAILDRRSHLINAYAMATRLGDGAARREILEQIRKFSRKNPEVAITGDTLQRSLAQRARYSARAEHGITLDRRLASRVREAVGD